MEPLLLEDYEIGRPPKSLANLLKSAREERVELNKHDLLVIFLYVLMLEAGFRLKGSREGDEDLREALGFHYGRLLELTKTLPGGLRKQKFDFELQPHPEYPCTMACVSFGDDVIVNCFVRNVKTANSSVILDPSIYIVDLNHYQNLRGLSALFKTQIAHKIKCWILNETGSASGDHVLHLPNELIEKIFLSLKIGDLLNAAAACRRFRSVSRSKKIWLEFLRRDFDWTPSEGGDYDCEALVTKYIFRSMQKKYQTVFH